MLLLNLRVYLQSQFAFFYIYLNAEASTDPQKSTQMSINENTRI
jgi:hypothetical protein